MRITSPYLAVFASMMTIAGCGKPSTCEIREQLSEVASPSKSHLASIYSNVCAAGFVTYTSVTVEIHPTAEPAQLGPGQRVVFGMEDFGATSRAALRTNWLSEQALRITVPNEA
jgi:hypothetical protein